MNFSSTKGRMYPAISQLVGECLIEARWKGSFF
jgi:DNA-binding PadR family transcriptional regulator